MDYLDALRLLALQSVVRGDSEYSLRAVFRWYSKTFATPLHVVEAQPLEDIFRHYLETQYEELGPQEREAEIRRLTESQEDLRQRRLQEDADDAETLEFAAATEAQERAKKKKPESGPGTMAAAASSLEAAGQDLRAAATRLTDAVPEALAAMKTLPPNIKMDFVDDKEFRTLLDRDYVPDPKKTSG